MQFALGQESARGLNQAAPDAAATRMTSDGYDDLSATAHAPSNGTIAQAGPPSRALPEMRASRMRPFPVSADRSSVVLMPVSGTLARRVQQEPACPAIVPELT